MTFAFFGASGGCVNASLVHALRDGNKCVALVRNPDKLRNQLQDQGLQQSLLASPQLTIIKGNALNVEDVKKAITDPNTGGKPVDTIVSGLGAAPTLRFNWREPWNFVTLDNPSLCENAAATLIKAADSLERDLSSEEKPVAKPALVFISTTGISRGPDDVPFWLRFLYHVCLAVPHQDKRKMEAVFRDSNGNGGAGAHFRSATGIRPTLLTGTANVNDCLGLHRVRAGTEPSPAMGYQIKRADVGHWIYANLLRPAEAETKAKWEGQMCTLTS